MASIGTTLREERIRLGLGIDQVEADTKIRAKYLMALEDERFEALPGTAYARAFLRDYAEQLGLDPQELVNRLNAVVGADDDVVLAPRRGSRPARSWAAGSGSRSEACSRWSSPSWRSPCTPSWAAARAAPRPVRRSARRRRPARQRPGGLDGPDAVARREGEGHVPCRPGKHLARGAAGLGEGQGPLRAGARRRQPHPARSAATVGRPRRPVEPVRQSYGIDAHGSSKVRAISW